MRIGSLLLVTAVLLGSRAGAAAAEPDGARAFVDRVYRQFSESRHAPEPTSQVFYALFEPGLRALLERDEKQTQPGDEGCLDYDPFSGSQDNEGLHHEIQSVSGDAAAASVRVRISYPPPEKPESPLVTYTLRRTEAAWTIEDISTATIPSFRKWLADCLDSSKSGR
jgi:hypothetical protein